MSTVQSPSAYAGESRVERIASFTGWVLAALALMVLVGWAFHIPALISVVPGLATMKPNTAAAFLLAGLALIRRNRRDFFAYSLGVLVIGAASLLEYLTKSNFGIDQLLFHDPYSAGDSGRMSQFTSVGVTVLGVSLGLMKLKSEIGRRVSRGFGLVTGALGVLAILGYTYNTQAPYQVRLYSTMALHTAIAFVIAAIGVQCANPTEGAVRLIRADSAGGAMLRQFLPAALLVPYFLGLAVWLAHKHLHWEMGFALALLVAATISFLVLLMLLNARRLEREDLEQRQANRTLVERTALLQAQEELLKLFVKHSPAAVAMFDRGMRYLQVSDRWCADFLLESPQILCRSHYEVFPDIPDRWKQIHCRGLNGETLRAEEDRWDRGDGNTTWLRWEVRPWGDRDGLPEGILIFSEDITARKQAETALRESENQFRTLGDSIPQLAWMANPDGWLFWYNRRWYEYTGTTPVQMEGWGWQSVHDPEVLPKVLERWKGSIATGEPFDMVFPLRGADGVFRPFLTRVMPVKDTEGKVVRWFGTNTDISEQKRVEEKLRKSKERLDLAVEVADLGEWNLNLVDRTASCSLRHAQIFGYQSVLPEWTYEKFLDHVLPQYRSDVLDKFNASLTGGTLDVETEIRRADGELRWIWARGRCQRDQLGQPTRMIGTVMDITEHKQAEEMLRESETTTRALFEAAAQAILAVDADGAIVWANRMASEMFGYRQNELLGKCQDLLLPERLREQHARYRTAFITNPATRPMGIGMGLLGLRKDGSEFPIEVSLSYVLSRRGPLAVSFVSDISARKLAESALRTSQQQLQVLAGSLLTVQEDERRRLSRELHDDITQRLAFLSFELGKLAGETPNSVEEMQASIRALQEQTLQTSAEVRRISHGLHPSVIEDFGLSVALEEFCGDFEKAQGVHVRFEGLVDDSRLHAACAGCLYRITQESLRNAVTHGRATEICVKLSVGSGSVRLRVTDNGTGFLTDSVRTKAGLGIISMRERIRLVHGTLSLYSQPGQGTQVVASVPLVEVGHE